MLCWRAFATWNAVAAAPSACGTGLSEQKLVIQRMRNMLVSLAFGEWRARIYDIVSDRARLSGAVRRLSAFLVARAFAGWLHSNAEKRRHAVLLGVATNRLQHATEYAILSAWHRRARILRAQRDRLEHCVARLMHALLASALDGWRRNAIRQKRFRSVTETIVRRIGSMLCWRAFATWNATAARSSRVRRAATILVTRMGNMFLGMAFNQWKSHVHAIVTERARLSGAVRRLSSFMVARAFAGWLHSNAEKRRHAVLLGLATNRLQHAVEYAVFMAWRSRAHMLRGQRQKLSAVWLGLRTCSSPRHSMGGARRRHGNVELRFAELVDRTPVQQQTQLRVPHMDIGNGCGAGERAAQLPQLAADNRGGHAQTGGDIVDSTLGAPSAVQVHALMASLDRTKTGGGARPPGLSCASPTSVPAQHGTPGDTGVPSGGACVPFAPVPRSNCTQPGGPRVFGLEAQASLARPGGIDDR